MTLPDDMQALVLNNDGFALKKSGSVLEALDPYVTLTRIGVPQPGPSQVLVKVSLASINPSDVMFIKGQYGQPRAKGQPAGFEGVGTVVAAGEAAAPLVGKRIAFATGQSGWGSWADYAIAEAGACIPLIDGVRDEDGAALIVNPLTAIAMFGIVREAGEKAFVMTAGASQLSKLILELAKEAGYRPIVTVRRDDQIEALKAAGAAHVLNATARRLPGEAARGDEGRKAAHLPRRRHRLAGLADLRGDAARRALDHLRPHGSRRHADQPSPAS